MAKSTSKKGEAREPLLSGQQQEPQSTSESEDTNPLLSNIIIPANINSPNASAFDLILGPSSSINKASSVSNIPKNLNIGEFPESIISVDSSAVLPEIMDTSILKANNNNVDNSEYDFDRYATDDEDDTVESDDDEDDEEESDEDQDLDSTTQINEDIEENGTENNQEISVDYRRTLDLVLNGMPAPYNVCFVPVPVIWGLSFIDYGLSSAFLGFSSFFLFPYFVYSIIFIYARNRSNYQPVTNNFYEELENNESTSPQQHEDIAMDDLTPVPLD
ncbi:uncharacterized protein SCDLUD_003527 [Saccharomycodes ludwigii]|uniref:uncharacterized protein n=1 Tax=Saccharomycodes ludwigii TaxID=36035 RepID=UPI001E890871|nr:hypothetical protein SCDLUD_003527 [Saccharomycodes ludwigii]KAH3900540.1 hypothetical protein SCDLUD_003527 [Saccharomycodes ludwigii]